MGNTGPLSTSEVCHSTSQFIFPDDFSSSFNLFVFVLHISMPSAVRYRHVVFTSFTDSPPEWDESICSYLVYGRERCPETGRQHWQCYCELVKQSSLARVRSIFGPCHFERRAGTADQAATYCKKDGVWTEFGTISHSGTRSDLASIGRRILSGERIGSIAATDPGKYIQYGRGLDQLGRLVAKTRQRTYRPVYVTIIWGVSGVGKTRSWFDKFGDNGYRFQYSKNNDWWDGYSGEKHILFDEFSSQISLSNMLMYLDVYPMRMEIKGGYTYADWDTVTIISNDNPQTFYHGDHVSTEKRNAFARRINCVIEMRKHYTQYNYTFAFANTVEFVTADNN